MAISNQKQRLEDVPAKGAKVRGSKEAAESGACGF
jgi:hypothetical protein